MSDGDDDAPIAIPPEGSTCSEHADRAALAVCPRCRRNACLACWHQALRRCQRCLLEDPLAAAPAIPWERPDRGLGARFFATLATALRPNATAPAFARASSRAAWSFFALSFLPLAAIAQIVTRTEALLFAPVFSITPIGTPSSSEIALDVVRAMGLGVVVCTIYLLAFALPYVSLARAYGTPSASRDAPVAVVLYRAFLVPLGLAAADLLGWNASALGLDVAVTALALARVTTIALLFVSLRGTARMASGVGPFASFVVAIVPFVLMALADEYLLSLLHPPVPADAANSMGMGEPG